MMKKRFTRKAKQIFSAVVVYLFVCQPMHASIPSDPRRCIDLQNQIIENAMIFPSGTGDAMSGTNSFASGSNEFPVPREIGKDTMAALGRMPLKFVENHGQTDGTVKYYAKKGGMTIYLTAEEIVLDFIFYRHLTEKNKEIFSSADEKKDYKRQVVRMKMQGANAGPVISGKNKQATVYNYFIGNDPSKWRMHVPVFSEVYYNDVYAGIDLKVYSAANGAMEYDFIVHPGADASQIAVVVDGIEGMEIDAGGDLVMKTAFGDLRQELPLIYQEVDGKKVAVPNRFSIHEVAKTGNISESALKFQYGFTVSAYDRTRDLIIDPLLASTFLGGSSYDGVYSMNIDASGHVFAIGATESIAFPVSQGADDTTHDGSEGDAFISKFNNDLTELLSCTFLGGGMWENGNAIGFDASGNVLVAGNTYSSDYPTTSGVYDRSFNGGDCDAFVAKFNNNLTELLASTLIGGSQFDTFGALGIGPAGDIFISGYTKSPNYPCTSGAYDASHNGETDVSVSCLNKNLTQLLASTLIGGSQGEWSYSLGIDSSGNVYVSGATESPAYPGTAGAYDPSYNGSYDAFLSKFNSGLTILAASTFLGGSDHDRGNTLKIDTSGNVFVVGRTHSSEYPCTSGAYDTSLNEGEGDAVVSKLNGDLSVLLASTLIGGTGMDDANAICFDVSGNVYIAGDTKSTDYPCSSSAYDTSHNGGDRDAFCSKLNNNLTRLLFSTYIGGTGEDAAYAMNIDASGYIFVAGETESSDYPITAGAYDRSFNGDDDAFISKFSEPLFPPSNLTAKSTSSRSIVLGWKDNSVNETGFKIERRQGGCSASGAWSQIATKPANTTTHTVSGLNPDTAYSYRVRAYDAGSNSAFTNCASTTTGKSGTPSSPIGLTATSASPTKVNLRWQDKSDDETGFKIYRKQGTGAWAELDRVAANMVSYSDETAENNRTSTAYQYSRRPARQRSRLSPLS